MFKLIAGKKYVRRNGEVVTLKRCEYNASWLTDGKWVFNPSHPDVDGYHVFITPYNHDIVAPYKAPRKASSPYNKLLTAKDGDIFLLKGEKFIFHTLRSSDKVFLQHNSRIYEHGYTYIHVRNCSYQASFRREELIELLRKGEYVIE